MYLLLIHTMTIAERDYVLQAQFVHAANGRLIARRMRLRLCCAVRMRARRPHPKARRAHVRHHLRAVKIGNHVTPFQNVPMDEKTMVSLSPASSQHSDKQPEVETPATFVDGLLPGSNPQQTVSWLNANRFEKFVQTFANFSGADMLRMSREDLMQICGHADGIRLYNGLHSKTVAPKLTLYVCKENSPVFNAVYLTGLNAAELLQKLSGILNVPTENIRDVYVHGPQMIHVQLSAEMIQHIKDETMFSVEIIQSTNNDGKFVVLLKPINKS